MTAREFTWGTHNLHDDVGTPTMFADAVIFTEAIPHTIHDDLGRQTLTDRARRAAAHARLRATGHTVKVCTRQPDLVFVCRRKIIKVTGTSYTRYVEGRPKVTPNRGTFIVFGEHVPTGTRVAFVGEHRINAAFPPYRRGEKDFRARAWQRHTEGTWATILRLSRSGWTVLAGGDLNTPPHVHGYPVWMQELGDGLDRLGLAGKGRLRDLERLTRKGSDHPRVRATVRL